MQGQRVRYDKRGGQASSAVRPGEAVPCTNALASLCRLLSRHLALHFGRNWGVVIELHGERTTPLRVRRQGSVCELGFVALHGRFSKSTDTLSSYSSVQCVELRAESSIAAASASALGSSR